MTTASEKIRAWRHDPVLFVREQFKVEPDAWQAEALRQIKPEGINRLCMKACAGPGKSAVLAWLGWWHLSCFAECVGPGAYEHPKGIACSITGDNLRANLWPEFAKWRNRSAFLKGAFEWQKERIFAKDHPETWFLEARSFAKDADALKQGDTLSGHHSLFPFILLDESGSMNPSLGRTAEQAMGGAKFGLIAQAGNTTEMGGLLYESAVTDAANWKTVTITADPDDPNRTPRVSREWAEEMIRKYTRDSPWVMAYVLGKFPPGSMNALLGITEVEAAIARVITADQLVGQARILGVDVARFGDDRTVIVPRQGRGLYLPVIMRNARTTEIAARVAKAYKDWKAHAVMVDGTGGYGAGVVDHLQQAGVRVFDVQFAGKADDSARYFNKRTEIHFRLAEWVKTGGQLPDIPELKRELTAPTYYFQDGRQRLEEKDQIKRRLGWSPDIADGAALTFAVPIFPPADEIQADLDGIPGGAHLASYLVRKNSRALTGADDDQPRYE